MRCSFKVQNLNEKVWLRVADWMDITYRISKNRLSKKKKTNVKITKKVISFKVKQEDGEGWTKGKNEPSSVSLAK